MNQHFLIVDVGGTKILAAALDQNGAILTRCKLKTDRNNKAAMLAQIDEAMQNALNEARLSRTDVAGVALGVPGVVNAGSGHVVFTPNTALTDTPLGELLGRQWNCPVIVGNDVSVGMAGESWRGAARGASSAYGIFVGTGIGGGFILNGQPFDGFRGLGGEIGHLMIPLDASEQAGLMTKKHSFLEDLCSRTAIENQLRYAINEEGKKSALTQIVGDKKLTRIRSGALKKALAQEDPLVTDVVRRASYLLGFASASVLHVVDPEVIVFGGGVIEACGKWMMPWISKTVERVAMQGTGAPPKIVQSQLGDDAILIGGLALLKNDVAAKTGGAPVFASVDKPVRS